MADLTQQILDFAGKGPGGLDEESRLALLQASFKLTAALENPFEKTVRMLFNIYDPILLRIAIDLDLVDIALAHGGPITLPELASKSKADPALLERILRMLVPLDIFMEKTPGTYTTTPIAPILATGSPLRATIFLFTYQYRGVVAMPEYFAANGYLNPTDALDSPFTFAHDRKGHTFFEHIAEPGNEKIAAAFNMTMEMAKSRDETSFMRSYPAAERLKLDESENERVLFVDVGGSMGHQVRKFETQYPDLPGKLVLEDLPEVVEQAVDVPDSIVKLAHDFFKPQPDAVIGAKAFYLRTILHDWPEKQARSILENIVKVMRDDSVVLVHEVILPETEVSHLDAQIDWHMMNLGALERTEKQWGELAESVGLKVNGIWWEEQGMGRRGMLELGKKV